MKNLKNEKGSAMMYIILLAILGISMGVYMYNSKKSVIRSNNNNYYNSYNSIDDSYYNNYNNYTNYYNY